jgi:hypothetical protein
MKLVLIAGLIALPCMAAAQDKSELCAETLERLRQIERQTQTIMAVGFGLDAEESQSAEDYAAVIRLATAQVNIATEEARMALMAYCAP